MPIVANRYHDAARTMPTASLDARFFARIARRVEQKNELTDMESAAFAAAIAARAIYMRGRDCERSLMPIADYPGYLARDIGSGMVFVPFNLVQMFPGLEILREMREVAGSVRLEQSHPIALSGSTTFLGRLNKAADLDFCEYYATDSAGLAASVCGKLKNGAATYLASANCYGRIVRADDIEFHAKLSKMLYENARHPPCNPVKLDFIHFSDQFGATPVTNVVLPIASADYETGNAKSSFAYQEAIMGVVGPPRGLLNPVQFAIYLNWLKNEAEKWLSAARDTVKAPVKALKRLLAAFLLMGYEFLPEDEPEIPDNLVVPGSRGDPISVILDMLNGDVLSEIVDSFRWQDLCAMSESVAGLPTTVSRLFAERADNMVEAAFEFHDAARMLAEALLEFLSIEFDQAEMAL